MVLDKGPGRVVLVVSAQLAEYRLWAPNTFPKCRGKLSKVTVLANFGTKFGQLVRDKRGIEGLSQDELAARAEMKKARISDIERGKVRKPQAKTVDAICVALNISIEERRACHTSNDTKDTGRGDLSPTTYVPFNGLPVRDPSEAIDPGAEITGIASLIYRTRIDDWLGREAVLKFLATFLERDRTILWQLVHGEGGVGKSRLALHFLHNLPAGWAGGFLRTIDLENFQLPNWRPTTNTLIVVDYAATDARRLGEMLVTLQRSARHYSGFRVRVLLLERNADQKWLNDLKEVHDGDGIDLIRFADHYLLQSLSDNELVSLMQRRIERQGKPSSILPDKLLSKLVAIDSKRRPLFAAILAEAVSEGEDIDLIERDKLLAHTLDREQKRLWLNAEERESSKLPADLMRHANLLALATMTKGLQRQTYRDLVEHPGLKSVLPTIEPSSPFSISDERLTRISSITLPSSIEDIWLSPFEPDLLGEFFVMRRLLDKDRPPKAFDILEADQRQAMIDVAWQVARLEMTDFTIRAGHDFPELFQQLRFLEPSRIDENSCILFSSAQVSLIHGNIPLDIERDLHQRTRDVLLSWPSNRSIIVTAAAGGFNLLKEEVESINIAQATEIFEWLLAFGSNNKDYREVIWQITQSGYMLVEYYCKIGDVELAKDVFNKIRKYAFSYRSDAIARQWLSQSAYTIIYAASHTFDIQTMREFYEWMKSLKLAYSRETHVHKIAMDAAQAVLVIEAHKGDINSVNEAYKYLEQLKSQAV